MTMMKIHLLILQRKNLLELYGLESMLTKTYQIKLTSKTDLTLNITSEDGDKYVDNAVLKYQYNAKDGKFTSSYEDMSIAGTITKTEMTFTIEGEKIILKKKWWTNYLT